MRADHMASAVHGDGAYGSHSGTPFVGRGPEIERLNGFLAQTMAGQGQVCFISGEAGTGKTALAAEFARLAQAQHPDLLVTVGAGNAQTGIGDPYLPFREALVMLTSSGSEGRSKAPGGLDGRAVTQAALARTVQILIDVAPELVGLFVPGAKIAGALGKAMASKMGWMDKLEEVAGTSGKPVPEQQRIFEQYTAFLQQLSRQHPLLLFLDDLHWADSSSISLLFQLSRHTRESRVMIVGMYRPEEVHLERGGSRHPLAQVINECMRYYGDIVVDLNQAQAKAGRQFVDGLIDIEPNRLDESFRSELFRLTGGHALFTVELLRMLQFQGDLLQDDQGRWIAGPELDWTRLPARVEGVIEERIARLEQDLRGALSVASVQGRDFDAEVVAEVESLNPRHLVRQLGNELARQHRLVEALGVRRLGLRMLSQYRFMHNLFQQYLYSDLDEVERCLFHEDIARVLESLYATHNIEDVAGQLAHHFQQAGMASKAIAYRLLAAHEAARVSAYQEAIAHLTEGLALLASLSAQRDPEFGPHMDGDPRLEGVYLVNGAPTRDSYEMAFQTALAAALAATEGWSSEGAKQAYLRAYELGEALGRPAEMAGTVYGMAVLHELRGQYEESEALMQEHLRLSDIQRNPRKAIASYELLSCSTFHQGLFHTSLEHADQGLALYVTHLQDVELTAGEDLRVACHGWGAMDLWFLGHPDQALARVNAAIALGETLDHPYSLVRALSQAASVHHMRHEADAALPRAEAAVAIASAHHLAYFVACAKVLRGWAMAAHGNEEGIAELRTGLEEHKRTGAEMDHPYFLGMLAEAYQIHNRPEEALAAVQQALEMVHQGRSFFYEAELQRLKGFLLIAPGPSQDTAEGEASLRKALSIARAQKARALELRAATSLARVGLARGDAAGLQLLREVYAEFDEGFDTRDLIEARELLEGGATSTGRPAPRRDMTSQYEDRVSPTGT